MMADETTERKYTLYDAADLGNTDHILTLAISEFRLMRRRKRIKERPVGLREERIAKGISTIEWGEEKPIVDNFFSAIARFEALDAETREGLAKRHTSVYYDYEKQKKALSDNYDFF